MHFRSLLCRLKPEPGQAQGPGRAASSPRSPLAHSLPASLRCTMLTIQGVGVPLKPLFKGGLDHRWLQLHVGKVYSHLVFASQGQV